MKKSAPIFWLFVIIALEGYVVLSAELLAIRQSIPYVGSGTDTVSIIIAAVLMPLAAGYFVGGQFKPGWQDNGTRLSIRRKLIQNILFAAILLLLGLSHLTLSIFYETLIQEGLTSRLVLTTLHSALFIAPAVYFLGQTIPLISHYFPKETLASAAGKILFFSTLGSFMGAVFSTLVLMSFLGVHHTVSILFVVLAALVLILSKNKHSPVIIQVLCITVLALGLNSDEMMRGLDIVNNNQYNKIVVKEKDGARFMSLNNNASAKMTDDGSKHPYIKFVETAALGPIRLVEPRKNILVIGAGGFTFGFDDQWNDFDYVDIDPSLKAVAEEHLLKQKIGENKVFHPLPARAYLNKTDEMYDVIFLDVFHGDFMLPEHLATHEFFQQIKDHLNSEGLVFANFGTSPNFKSKISRNLDNTWRSVFPHSTRTVMLNDYAPWNDNLERRATVIYMYRYYEDEDPQTIYTDNKNPIFFDRP